MQFTRTLTAGAILAFAAATASAQTVGIGTTKGGATAQVTAAISKVVSTYAGGLQMRTQVMGGTQKYIPVVNAGELEFGVSNMMQYYMAKTGTGLSKGKKHGNLRLVANMMKFRISWIVPRNSGIRKVSDLRGKRIPGGFKGAPLFHHLLSAGLANGGLSYDDVEMIPYIGLRQHWNAFKQGKIDAAWAAIGTGAVKDMNAKIKGGVRFISLETSSTAAKATTRYAPKTFFINIKPAKPLVGVMAPVDVLAFDYMLWVHKAVSNDVVGLVAKAMYEHEKELHAASPLWRSHRSKTMAKDQGEAYHPGAISFYKKSGIWKR